MKKEEKSSKPTPPSLQVNYALQTFQSLKLNEYADRGLRFTRNIPFAPLTFILHIAPICSQIC